MCLINPDIVREIEVLAGSQADIMRRLGISWNCWISIVGGLPIRLSVGERLRDRIMDRAGDLPGLCAMFPSIDHDDAVDREALAFGFLTKVTARTDTGMPICRFRSVRGARGGVVLQSEMAP